MLHILLLKVLLMLVRIQSIDGLQYYLDLYFVSDNLASKGGNLFWNASAKNLLRRDRTAEEEGIVLVV